MSVIFNPKFLIIALLVAIIFLLVLIRFFPANNPQSLASPSPTPVISIPGQPVEIGKTVTEQVESLPNIVNKEALADGSTKYTLSTSIPLRSDLVIVKDDHVIFQSKTSSLKLGAPDYLKISDLIKEYGQPEKIIPGSFIYGPFSSIYVYSSKGFAFIGNPNTDEIYEMQSFRPLEVNQYIEQYVGENPSTTPAPEEP
jgi:hypothetical protein